MYDKCKVLDSKNLNYSDLLITLEWEHKPSFFERLLGRKATLDKGSYIGHGFCWYRLPSYTPVSDERIVAALIKIWRGW